jgi:hypothetical protein
MKNLLLGAYDYWSRISIEKQKALVNSHASNMDPLMDDALITVYGLVAKSAWKSTFRLSYPGSQGIQVAKVLKRCHECEL